MALILPGTAQVHKGGGVKLGALNLTRRDGSAFERLITQSIADTPLPVNPTQESRHV